MGDNEDPGDTPSSQLKNTDEEEVEDHDGGSVRRMLDLSKVLANEKGGGREKIIGRELLLPPQAYVSSRDLKRVKKGASPKKNNELTVSASALGMERRAQ